MENSVSGSSLPPEVSEQLRALCTQFEAAWKKGKSPGLDDYLGDITGEARAQLVRELTEIEVRYRRDSMGPSAKTRSTFQQEPELVTLVEQPAPPSHTDSHSQQPVESLQTQGVKSEVTIAHESRHEQTKRSTSGLLIRCPHCSMGVELLADTPFEDISCTDCGSTFKLVDREKLTTAAVAPKSIGRFKLEERLGAGGFGTVWKARDEDLDRVVAIKIPRKSQLGPTDVEQFYREARAAAQLRHPNIVPVYEVGRDGNQVFIVSDIIHGQSLSQWLIDRRLNSQDVARLCILIAEALEHAHRNGIIHRDMKPSNVMIDEADQPHLMDYGLAKREVGEVTMTVDGQILGTPSYMSPEQASGQSHWVDRRTDIYSLGVMIFKLLTNELPFRGNIQKQIQQRLSEDAPNPRSLNRHIPRDAATICLKCLERDPNKRYQTAQAIADELRRFLRGEPIHARPISRVARVARWAKRKPAQATAAVLTLFLATAGPLTALVIEGQRQRVVDLLKERDNQIAQSVTDATRSTNKITRLENQLDLWEGRANPFEFWPPHPADNPRQLVLTRLYEQHYATLVASLQDGPFDDRQLACGHLGLALIAEQMKQPEEAENHALVARRLLEELVKQQPDSVRYLQALAQCYTQLGRLYGNSRKQEAAAALIQAGMIYEQLAAENKQMLRYRVGRLESELRGAVLGGFDSAKARLLLAEKIEQTLQQNWPTDPVAFYDMASFLTEQEPVLSELENAAQRDE